MAETVTGSYRAVKVVRREDFELEKTFEREFQGICHYEKISQDCPGLVDVLHVGRDEEGGFYYYVMELADDVTGETIESVGVSRYRPKTLAAALKTSPVRHIPDCVMIGHGMARALAHLHREGLVHRDVKPSNIIYVRGVPKLADIGLMTRGGQRTYVGTEGYVPPEGPGSASADLYALAMVLYEMQTGKDRLDFPELPSHLQIGPTVNREEWRALNAAICRAGSPDPAKRFESGEAFAEALRKIRPELFSQAEAPLRQPSSGRNRAALFAGAALLAASILAWSFFPHLWREEPRESAAPPPPANAPAPEPATAAPAEPVPGPTPIPVETQTVDPASAPVADLPPADDPSPAPAPLLAVPVEPVSRLVRFDSVPGNAEVWINGQEIGRTPLPSHPVALGTARVLFRKEGYLDQSLTREIAPGKEDLSIRVNLIEDRRPSEQVWKNSLNLSFSRSVTGEYLASVPSSTYTGFLTSTGRLSPTSAQPIAVVAPAGSSFVPQESAVSSPGEIALVTDAELAWQFCDWMTAYDRQLGYLDDRQYHAPVPPPAGAPRRDYLFCAVKKEFHHLEVRSRPEGAEIRDAPSGQRLGQTPATLSLRRGPYHLEISKDGYRPVEEKGYLSGEDSVALTAQLERDESVVFGELWINSQSMPLLPVGPLMAAQFETRTGDYLEFRPEFPSVATPNHPVAGVSRGDAEAFCRWLTEKERREGRIRPWHVYRLPSDREWSRLAGLPEETGATPRLRETEFPGLYAWGPQWPPPHEAGNFAGQSSGARFVISGYDDPFPFTAPVGSFPANAAGLHDLAGNVWEWVSDFYDGEQSELGVVRGGGWDTYQPGALQLSYRNAVSAVMRETSHGFRYVLADLRTEKGDSPEN